jgi:hypothetical protein
VYWRWLPKFFFTLFSEEHRDKKENGTKVHSAAMLSFLLKKKKEFELQVTDCTTQCAATF